MKMRPWKFRKSVLNKTLYILLTTLAILNRVALISTQTERNVGNIQTNTTIDVADVKLFSKYMDDWWNPNGIMSLLHRMNSIRVPFVRDGLSTNKKKKLPLKNKKILDVGCGGGILSEELARLGACVTGIDANEDLILIAEKHKSVDPTIAQDKLKYINCTIEEHATTVTDHYDAVVASEVIEHVQNPQLFVKSCIQAVKPGGRLFFTTPNKTRLTQFIFIFMFENVLKIMPKGAHQIEKFITPNELTYMLESNNCAVELTYGITYNPIFQKWYVSQYFPLIYVMQAVKLQ